MPQRQPFSTLTIDLIHLDVKLNATVRHMTDFFQRTEQHLAFQWQTLVSNRLAIKLLSSGAAMYDMVL